MLEVREAAEEDVPHIRDIFMSVYQDYPYKQFFEIKALKKICFSDNILMLVCEDTETQKILGTACVTMEVGAYTDLIGEFGRLAVSPDARGRGIGKLLMQKRIEYAEKRLHVGIVEARAVHPFAQKISGRHNFAVVGFLPNKHPLFGCRENVVHLVRYFNDSLALRKNHPRIIPEIYHLASLTLTNLKLPVDTIVEEDVCAYPYSECTTEELTTEGYANLLRIQRGRLKKREIFGPVRLHYGFFRLSIKNACYLIAKKKDNIVGAIGFIADEVGKTVKIFELITLDDESIRFLFQELEKKCQLWDILYIEVDVNAYAPCMQKTLIELQYLPVSYIPALVFHDVERLDAVRMVRLLMPFELGDVKLIESVQEVSNLVITEFTRQSLMLQLEEDVISISLFSGLTKEQIKRLALIASIEHFSAGDTVVEEGVQGKRLFIILQGKVVVEKEGTRLGVVGIGESIGEMSLISEKERKSFASVKALEKVKALAFDQESVQKLAANRADIAAKIYKNLAWSLGEKLKRLGDDVLKNLFKSPLEEECN